MNPSLLVSNDRIRVILRQINYTLYHSEKKRIISPWGPLTYMHPEDDMHLRTENWYLELNDNLEVTRYNKIDTSKFDTYEPRWEFVGLEDARLVYWNNKHYITGVRRDTTENGQGRMELSEIDINENNVTEVSRTRIEPPLDPTSYCEKNWMPVRDKPFTYVKWSNPTEVVEVNGSQSTRLCIHESIPLSRDIRGGSQILSVGDYYLGLTHEVDLFKDKHGRKDGNYWHRFMVWDKEWNIVKYSKEFTFLSGHIEFAIGMDKYKDDILITFGFQDNAAYVLRTNLKQIQSLLNDDIEITFSN